MASEMFTIANGMFTMEEEAVRDHDHAHMRHDTHHLTAWFFTSLILSSTSAKTCFNT